MTDSEVDKVLMDMLAGGGVGIMQDGKRIAPNEFYFDPRDAAIAALQAENEKLREENARLVAKILRGNTSQHELTDEEEKALLNFIKNIQAALEPKP